MAAEVPVLFNAPAATIAGHLEIGGLASIKESTGYLSRIIYGVELYWVNSQGLGKH